LTWLDLELDDLINHPALLEQCRVDHYNALLATESGRRVLTGLLIDAGFMRNKVSESLDRDFKVLTTDRNNILARCGIDDVTEIVKVLVQVAKRYRPEEKPQTKKNLIEP